MSRRRSPVAVLRELLLAPRERAAAQAERRAEQTLRRERDHTETADRRAAALEAERRRYGNGGWGGPG